MKRIMKIYMLLLLTAACWKPSNAQNNAIFKGGNADGWTKAGLIQTSSSIFSGGNGDGWSSQNFIQASSGIFKGGNGDGWSSHNFAQLSKSIFTGGNGDGWSSLNTVQSNKSIFSGGNGDGWSSQNLTQLNKSIFAGGIGDGWASTYRPQGPLPVNLLYFTAVKYKNVASLLEWKTSQEINSSHFDVERSGDAIIFNKIGAVTAAGNSSVETRYNFTDNNPMQGMNYYRLKQVDLNGHFVYSPARLVRFDELDPATVRYYPNPTNGILTIELSQTNANEMRLINIINAAGAVMNQLRIEGSAGQKMQIDLSRYANGTYFIQLKTATLNSTERIVLQ